MNPLHYLIGFLFVGLLPLRTTAQSFDCSQLSITGLYQDETNAGEYWITVAFSGDNNSFINYPYIPAITASNGDTLATGNMYYFGQIGNTSQDYPVTLAPGASLDAFTATFILGTGDFAPINDTCYLSYPPTHVQQPSRMDAASWSCWPNPVRDHLFIQAEPRLIGQSYEIRSMLGQVVLKGTVQRETNIIDMAQWPTGIYIVRLNDETRGVRIAKVD